MHFIPPNRIGDMMMKIIRHPAPISDHSKHMIVVRCCTLRWLVYLLSICTDWRRFKQSHVPTMSFSVQTSYRCALNFLGYLSELWRPWNINIANYRVTLMEVLISLEFWDLIKRLHSSTDCISHFNFCLWCSKHSIYNSLRFPHKKGFW